MDKLGVGVLARVGGVQALLVGEDDQRVGFNQIGDERAQGVVVAKADFAGGHRVVFVDDRHHIQLEQGDQRRAGVQIAGAVGQVFVGEQHLGGFQAFGAKGGFIRLHQPHLADGGGGLQFVHRLGSGRPAQPLQPFGNRAGRHQHHLLAPAGQVGDFAGPARQRGVVQTLAIVGDQTGADLDDNALAGVDDGLHKAIPENCGATLYKAGAG